MTTKLASEVQVGDAIVLGAYHDTAEVLTVAQVRTDPHPSYLNLDFTDGTATTLRKSNTITMAV